MNARYSSCICYRRRYSKSGRSSTSTYRDRCSGMYDSVLLKRERPMMTDQKKLEIRFLVRTTISYIRRGPFPSLACDSIRGASLTVRTQARPPGPALADAPEAHLVRRLGAPRPAVRDEEGDPAEGRRHRRADRAGLVVSQAHGPAGRAPVQVIILDCC